MTLISKIKTRSLLGLFLLVVILLPQVIKAQSSLSISVSPTLFDMTANPGQTWESTLRVINSNPFELTVYTDVVNFSPKDEGGQGVFLPIDETEAFGQTLAEWTQFQQTEIAIPPEQTAEIPFVISVPEDAPPGGHFAAVLVGTRPPENQTNTSRVETSQVVTSLVFLRVTGDILESGNIREFRSLQSIADRPNIDFELRFENQGNVHILPQGEIVITNMWGQERGVIPVNKQSLFGNVLPDQIRKYSFSWNGEWSLADMGRYTAVATLAYGTDGRQFVKSETTFWVLPWKMALSLVLGVTIFFVLITWAIKAYIRRMLSLAGALPDKNKENKFDKATQKISVVAPIEEGMLDLRNRFASSDNLSDKFKSTLVFVSQYKKFFAVLLLVILFVSALVWFIINASVDERGYQVTVDGQGENVTISSEQLKYEEIRSERLVSESDTESNLPILKIINRSGVPGLAAQLGVTLESTGYEISDFDTDLGAQENNTVIVYHPDFADEALSLSREIPGALLSSFDQASPDEPIVVYVGSSYQDELE